MVGVYENFYLFIFAIWMLTLNYGIERILHMSTFLFNWFNLYFLAVYLFLNNIYIVT